MPELIALDSGAFYQHRGLHEPPFAAFFDRVVYLPELAAADLDPARTGALLVPCRTPPELLLPWRPAFADYLQGGGTLVALGETHPEQWLPGIRWTDTEVNFWWWLGTDPDNGVRQGDPAHGLWRHLSPRDVVWHYHGFFTPPAGACSVVDLEGCGSLLYDDRVSTPGRLILSALDPFYHHGSHFMPATTRFLTGFLPWLREEVAGPAAS